jgi:hypothetical protein
MGMEWICMLRDLMRACKSCQLHGVSPKRATAIAKAYLFRGDGLDASTDESGGKRHEGSWKRDCLGFLW